MECDGRQEVEILIMTKLSRKERKIRVEEKKEVIRKEIFKMCKDGNFSNEKLNFAVCLMMNKNPQENHLVQSVCSEIRIDASAFANKMLNKYGT